MTDVNVTNRPVRVQVKTVSRPIKVNAATAKQIRAASPVINVESAQPRRDVVIKDPVTTVIDTGGKQGVPGPQGPAGPAGGSSIELQAGETMFGLRAVRASGGIIYRPDRSIVEHSDSVIGIVLQSGNAGALLQVQLSGELSEQSWTWSPGAIYCGNDGVLTQAPPPTGWLLSIGRATSTTTIIIDIDTAFIRG